MIRVKIYDLPNFPPSLRTREDPKNIQIFQRSEFSKKYHHIRNARGFRRVIARGPLLSPPGSLLGAVSAVAVGSRFSRDPWTLARNEISLPLPLPPRAPIADQHQRALAARSYTRDRTTVPYGAVQWRSEVAAVPASTGTRSPLPPINYPFYAPPCLFLFLFRQPRANQPPPSRRATRREIPPPSTMHVYMQLLSLSLSSFTPFSIPPPTSPPPSLLLLCCLMENKRRAVEEVGLFWKHGCFGFAGSVSVSEFEVRLSWGWIGNSFERRILLFCLERECWSVFFPPLFYGICVHEVWWCVCTFIFECVRRRLIR